MTDAGEPSPSEDAATQQTGSLEAIEQDLNNVDEALAALDAGDLDAAETLAAGLDAPGTPTPSDDQQSGSQQDPAGPAC